MHRAALLLIPLIAFLAFAAQGSSFLTDNAYGATANATRSVIPVLWGILFLLVVVGWQVGRVANALAKKSETEGAKADDAKEAEQQRLKSEMAAKKRAEINANAARSVVPGSPGYSAKP